MSAEPESPEAPAFSEREFYLREFRGRTLAVCVAASPGGALAPVLAELAAGGCRAVVLAPAAEALTGEGVEAVVSAEAPRLQAELWRALRQRSIAGVALGVEDFRARCAALALRLGVFKLVWLDPGGGLRVRSGERQSFVHLEDLRAWLAHGGRGLVGPERLDLWRAVVGMLEGGLPAVNVCEPHRLSEELFTYAGSGTLFTRERYMDLRRLGLDDFDAAHDLVRRGVEEGYLLARPPEELDRILAAGFGAFVEGRYLAGIGALLPSRDGRAGEISSLYTLTRFLGEGVGNELVGFAVAEAGRAGMERVFACTTSERVGAFFERNGFEAVGRGEIPPEKWESYDPARLDQVRCYRRKLG